MSAEKPGSIERLGTTTLSALASEYFKSDHFRQRAKLPNSQLAYKRDIRIFVEYCEEQQVSAVDQLAPEQVSDWFDYLKDNRYSQSTKNRNRASLKNFLDWLAINNWLTSEFTGALPPAFKITEARRRVLSKEQQIDLTRSSLKGHDLRGILLALIILETGAKLEDTLKLTVLDLRFLKDGDAIISFDDENESLISKQTSGVVVRHIENWGIRKNDFLFQSKSPRMRGKALNRAGAWTTVKVAGRVAEIDNLTTRTLRNTYFFNLGKP